jgi:hypothetical protein
MMAQNCDTSLLFKKGAQLEYRTYLPKTGLFSSKPDVFEVTRLTFIVDEVKDSNNMVYSYITKKGVAASGDRDGYEKKYVISCNDGRISVPVDFYSTDTIYLSDIYPNLRKKKFYSATNNQETVYYIFPVNPDKNKFELSAKKLTSDIVIRDFGWEQRDSRGNVVFSGGHWELSAQITETKYSLASVLENPLAEGKTKIRVPPGSFDCDKYQMKIKSTFIYPARYRNNGPGPDLNGKTIESTGVFYFNPKIGLVKTENSQGGYTELIRIKK